MLFRSSKDYGNTQPFRELFSHCEYVGVDLEDGKNVDYVVNLEEDLGPIKDQKFDLIIICSVLEHSPRPWVLAMHRAVSPLRPRSMPIPRRRAGSRTRRPLCARRAGHG